MYLGEGTPVEVLLASAPPGSGKAGLLAVPSRKSSPDSTTVTDTTDLVDLSDGARALLKSQNTEKGSEEFVYRETEQLHARLEQVETQINTLQRRFQRTGAEQAESIVRDLEQTGETLRSIGQQLNVVTQPVRNSGDILTEIISEFKVTTQSFTDLIIEVQEAFRDEDRLPPSLFTVIEGLIKAALLEPDALQKVNKLA